MDLIKRLDALGDVGASPTGITRVADSTADTDAKTLVASWMVEAGMRVTWDDHDNVIGYLPGDNLSLKPIVTGSHIDTVVNGGKFDGALGVVAGVEAAKELKGKLSHPLMVVAFHDEERTMSGSKGFSKDNDPHAFIELHVEQGPVLEALGADVGAVTGVVGQRRVRYTVFGEPNHGGTTPMDMRDDALVKASEAVLFINEEARKNGNITATVGELTVSPNKFSIVPGRVDFTVQVRDTDAQSMDDFVALINERFGFAYELLESQEPVMCDKAVFECIQSSIYRNELSTTALPSRAGHDAQCFIDCPMGMIFVPSRGGISHSPYEYTSPDQCYNGLNVLIEAIKQVDKL